MAYAGRGLFLVSPSFEEPEVRAAIESFLNGEWLPRHSTGSDLQLYHYTDLEGLKGILTSRSFWFTHSSSFNDPSELVYGRALVADVLRALEDEESDSAARKFLRKLSNLSAGFEALGYNVYAVSFCESDNLLSQWRAYASRGQGFSIGIRLTSDTVFYERLHNRNSATHVVLRRIVYDRREQADIVSRYVAAVLESVKKARTRRERSGNIPEVWDSVVVMQTLNVLFDLMLSFKHPAFSEEREWRLIKVLQSEFKSELVRFRHGDGQLVPYIPIYLGETRQSQLFFPIVSIKVGPMLDESSWKQVLEVFAYSQGALKHMIRVDPGAIRIDGAGYSLR